MTVSQSSNKTGFASESEVRSLLKVVEFLSLIHICKYYVIIKAEPAWTQPQRLKHQQPSIHEYIKEISDTQVNQAVSEKDMESIYEQYGKYLIETKNPVLKEYREKEITKKESIAAELKQDVYKRQS